MSQTYILQVLANLPGEDIQILDEQDFSVESTGAAIDTMLLTAWPPGAKSARLIDIEGRVISIGWSPKERHEIEPALQHFVVPSDSGFVLRRPYPRRRRVRV